MKKIDLEIFVKQISGQKFWKLLISFTSLLFFVGCPGSNSGIQVDNLLLKSKSAITETVGVASFISVSTGNNQSVVVGSVLPSNLVVFVSDAKGNPISGAVVDWSAAVGTLGSASSVSNASGFAEMNYNPDASVGLKSVVATIHGTTTSASFSATVQLPSAITPNIEISRTSGVAPLSVFFDASKTTTPTTSKPFLDVQCTWNFGDNDSVTWAYGSHVGDGSFLAKKNRAMGMAASHVYEQPGTYIPSVTCTDGVYTTATISLDPITVTNADSVFPGTNTICVAANSMPVPGGDAGCPSGSLAINATASYGSADFDQIINAKAVSGTRILLNRGDVFYSSTTAVVAGTLGILGAYGGGAKPLIRLIGVPLAVLSVGSSSAQAKDWRIMDLDIDGQAVAPISTRGIVSKGSSSQILFLRMDIHDIGTGYNFSSSDLDTWNKVGTVKTLGAVNATDTVFQVTSVGSAAVGQGVSIASTNGGSEFSVKDITNYSGMTITAVDSISVPNTITISHPVGVNGPIVGTTMSLTFWNLPFNPVHKVWDQIAIVDSTVQRMWGGGGALGIYMTSKRLSIMGSLVHDCVNSEFNIRLPYVGTGVISHNTLSKPSSNKSVLTLRAPSYVGGPTIEAGTYTEKVIVSDNKMVSNLELTIASVMPKNETSDERHRFVVIERNLFVSGVNTTGVLSINNANNDVVRNNIFDATLSAGGTIISFGGNGKAAPDTILGSAFNNTIYKGTVGGNGMSAVFIGAGSTSMMVLNNLMYAPNVTPGPNVFSVLRNVALPSEVVASNNTLDAQLKVDPKFTALSPVVPSDFRLLPNSYAVGTGASVPVFSDFFGNSQYLVQDIGAVSH